MTENAEALLAWLGYFSADEPLRVATTFVAAAPPCASAISEPFPAVLIYEPILGDMESDAPIDGAVGSVTLDVTDLTWSSGLPIDSLAVCAAFDASARLPFDMHFVVSRTGLVCSTSGSLVHFAFMPNERDLAIQSLKTVLLFRYNAGEPVLRSQGNHAMRCVVRAEGSGPYVWKTSHRIVRVDDRFDGPKTIFLDSPRRPHNSSSLASSAEPDDARWAIKRIDRKDSDVALVDAAALDDVETAEGVRVDPVGTKNWWIGPAILGQSHGYDLAVSCLRGEVIGQGQSMVVSIIAPVPRSVWDSLVSKLAACDIATARVAWTDDYGSNADVLLYSTEPEVGRSRFAGENAYPLGQTPAWYSVHR